MVDIVVRPTQSGDAEELGQRMRKADLDEIAAMGIADPVEALTLSDSLSTHSWTTTVDGEVAVMMGVTPVNMVTGVGCPWLLGSDYITKYAGAFMKRSLIYIPIMLEAYPHLFNYVDARNRNAVRWLKRAGFTLHEPVPHGPYSMSFHPFEMRA